MDQHADPRRLDPEELRGLDHLEALVHERRRVHGDLGAHGPGGMVQRLRGRHAVQRGEVQGAEGAARGGEPDPSHLFERAPLQQLEDRAVLAVHRQQAAGARRPGARQGRTAADQRLLVGQGQVQPALQHGQGDGESREAEHAVEGDVHVVSQQRVGRRARGQEAARGQRGMRATPALAGVGVGDHHPRGRELGDPVGQRGRARVHAERRQGEIAGAVAKHREGAAPDAAGGAVESNALHGQRIAQWRR